MTEIDEKPSAPQDEPLRLLTISLRKYTTRPEDRDASARNILHYAIFLAVAQLGPDAAEDAMVRGLSAAKSRRT